MINTKIIASSLNQTPMDWRGNIRRILTAIEEAKKRKAAFLALPELSLTGYGCEDWFLSKELADEAMERLIHEIVPATEGLVTMVGLPFWHLHSCYNAVAVVVDMKIRGFVFKKNLCHDGIHYEDRWFKEWPLGKHDMVSVFNSVTETYDDVPVGDVAFSVNGIVFGFEICEDAWASQRVGTKLVQRQVDIIFNPSASHFAFDKADIRRGFIVEGSRAFNCAYVYANLLGNEAGRVIYDGDTYIAVNGTMRSAGKRFSFNESSSCEHFLNFQEIRQHRAKIKSYNPHREMEDLPFVQQFRMRNEELNHVFYQGRNYDPYEEWEKKDRKEEEFTRAVSLGLWDYMRKTNSRGYVISLSGGADSTACAVLVKKAIEFAYESGSLKRKLKPDTKEGEKESLGDWENAYWDGDISDILTCVYQPTENSSNTTSNAASDVASGLKAKFKSVAVGHIVEYYNGAFAEAFGWNLNWNEDDITLQNIQARVRAPGIWMVANKEGKLLISTSNRSEAAVGYATMDGDTSGGLAPIAGIDKQFIRHWLKWMEEKEMPFLSCVNKQVPTAELRPLDNHQTDEEDLMPYEVLDCIERLIVREKLGVNSVFWSLQNIYPKIDKKVLFGYLKRFCTLWTRNQWKRERYAPAFHLDDHNLDPKTGCRFPIISKAFQEELKKIETILFGQEP